MSQENVNTVKRIAERINSIIAISPPDDVAELREFLAEFFAPDFVLTLVDGPPDQPHLFRGHEAALEYWSAFTDAFADVHREVEDLVDAGEWVISLGHWVGRGKVSGATVEGRGATVFRFRDGKVIEYLVGFPTKEAALEAAGLSE
jgi:ketosteroid isomerase-like protein